MKTPEICWSLMHPTPLNLLYMKKVIAEAANYQVDSFEICASCHTLFGGLGGMVRYEDYPAVAATLDLKAIDENISLLREIITAAHESGRPVYYWHREVTIWPALLKEFPDLLDQNGEFDLFGQSYEALLRYKISHAFAAVPELDGMVLTLTEADFSTIHNSTPDVYPPEQVAAHLIRIFADELAKLNKRFILRSFGSIAADYEQILAGAQQASRDFSFEVETKITPYDFDPFLPDNPFLKKLPGLTLGAECDSLGEFLGAGYLPAENVKNIVRYVRFGQQCGVDRFVIRLDRIGNNIFDTYPINLYAYDQAIRHPELTAEEIVQNYAETHYPAACREQLINLGYTGFEVTTQAQYIDQHLIFHGFPPAHDLKMLQAGGYFTLFQPGQPLQLHQGIWSILSDKSTPSREFIREEKLHACELAKTALAEVETLRHVLSESEYQRLHRLWNNAVIATAALRNLVEVTIAYFKDMENHAPACPELHRAITQMTAELTPYLAQKIPVAQNVYVAPLLDMAQAMLAEYPGEFAARQELSAFPGVIDFVVPGGLTDDGRCGRFTHASHAQILNGRPGRVVGNPVFPNGFVEIHLKGRAQTPLTLYLKGTGGCLIEANDKRFIRNLADQPRIEIPAASEVKVVLRKQGTTYPVVQQIALGERQTEF